MKDGEIGFGVSHPCRKRRGAQRAPRWGTRHPDSRGELTGGEFAEVVSQVSEARPGAPNGGGGLSSQHAGPSTSVAAATFAQDDSIVVGRSRRLSIAFEAWRMALAAGRICAGAKGAGPRTNAGSGTSSLRVRLLPLS